MILEWLTNYRVLSGPEKDKLDAAIDALPDRYKEVVRLRWLKKLKPPAMAARRGITRQEVYRQCGVAVDQIYKAVKGIVTERKKVVRREKAEAAEPEPVKAAKIEQPRKIGFIDAINMGLIR